MAELLPWTPIIGLVGTIITAIVGGVFLLRKTRDEGHAKRDPSWKELVDENRLLRKEMGDLRKETETRFDAIDRKLNAFSRVLSQLAEQWQGDPPILDQADIDELGTTLPVKFRPRRLRPRPSG